MCKFKSIKKLYSTFKVNKSNLGNPLWSSYGFIWLVRSMRLTESTLFQMSSGMLPSLTAQLSSVKRNSRHSVIMNHHVVKVKDYCKVDAYLLVVWISPDRHVKYDFSGVTWWIVFIIDDIPRHLVVRYGKSFCTITWIGSIAALMVHQHYWCWLSEQPSNCSVCRSSDIIEKLQQRQHDDITKPEKSPNKIATNQ